MVRQLRVLTDVTYRFGHALTRDVAHESLLPHQRRVVHERIGKSIEQIHADRIDDYSDLLASHFSEAELWADAVTYGCRSADRAMHFTQS